MTNDVDLKCYDDVWVVPPVKELREATSKNTPDWLTPEAQKARSNKQTVALTDPKFVKRMRQATTKAQNQWREYQTFLWYTLQSGFHAYLQQKVTTAELQAKTAAELKEAFFKAFAWGKRSSDVRKMTGTTPLATKTDTQWINASYKKTLKVWQKFVILFTTKSLGGMRWPDEIKKFIHMIDHVFQKGRLLGIGPTSLFFWVGPHDHATCSSCKYAHRNNPYTIDTLPMSPRSGSQQCRHNCRCHILIKTASRAEVAAVLNGRDPAKIKAHHIKELTALMQGGMVLNQSTGRAMKKKGYKPRNGVAPTWAGDTNNFF